MSVNSVLLSKFALPLPDIFYSSPHKFNCVKTRVEFEPLNHELKCILGLHL